MRERIERRADEHMAGKVAKLGPDVMRYVEKSILLQTLDHLWREHLVMLDHLRQVIGLRGYGQRDPLNEYKAEAFSLFEAMVAQLARGGHRAADARRDRAAAAGGGSAGSSFPTWKRTTSIRPPARTRWRWRSRRWLPAPVTATARSGAQGERNPKDPASWGKVGRNEPAPAAPARSSSTATASSPEGRFAQSPNPNNRRGVSQNNLRRSAASGNNISASSTSGP